VEFLSSSSESWSNSNGSGFSSHEFIRPGRSLWFKMIVTVVNFSSSPGFRSNSHVCSLKFFFVICRECQIMMILSSRMHEISSRMSNNDHLFFFLPNSAQWKKKRTPMIMMKYSEVGDLVFY
jgi:hypothetical protein